MSWLDWYRFIVGSSELSELLPILTFLFFPAVLKQYKWLFYYLIVNQLLNVGTIILVFNGLNNMPFYHIIGFFELILVFLFYKPRIASRLLKAMFWVVLAFYSYQSIVSVPFHVMNALARSCTTLYLTIIVLNDYYLIYKNQEVENIGRSFIFWINSALLIYLTTAFFAFLFSYEYNHRIASDDFTDLLKYGWLCYALGNLFKSLIISWGLVTCFKHGS